jgi:uncharacterized protein with von Willebrand factor type A (vWA) domain
LSNAPVTGAGWQARYMNAVEIEEAVSALASSPFDAGEFPYAFLAAFGNKETTVKRLRSGSSDVPGDVLQRNNIHMAICAPGEVGATLAALRQSPKTKVAKAKFVLATDGVDLETEELTSGEVIACLSRIRRAFRLFPAARGHLDGAPDILVSPLGSTRIFTAGAGVRRINNRVIGDRASITASLRVCA